MSRKQQIILWIISSFLPFGLHGFDHSGNGPVSAHPRGPFSLTDTIKINPGLSGRFFAPGKNEVIPKELITAPTRRGALQAEAACDHEGRVEEVIPVSCSNLSDGSITITGINGTAPYRYFLDNLTESQDTGFFAGLSEGNHMIIVEDQTGCQDTTVFEVPGPLPLSATIELEKAISCPDGADGILRVTATGGTGNYSFEWLGLNQADTNAVGGLNPGAYEVLVTDENNCETPATFTLDNPAGMQIGLSQIAPSCFDTEDGSVVTTISGGTPDYTYLWDNGEAVAEPANFAPGEHCVSVTDGKGCLELACVIIEAPEPVSLDSVSIVDAKCFETNTGSATVFVSGGDGNYSYLWDDDLQQIGQQALRLREGTYSVDISDGKGCRISTSVDISQPAPLGASASAEDAKCFGSADGLGSVEIIGGTEPFNYAWSSGGTEAEEPGLMMGTYEVSVTDANGCEAFAQIDIGQPATPVSVESIQIKQGCAGTMQNEAEATASGGTGDVYSFSWNDPLQQSGPIATGLDSNMYVVTAMDTNGCTGQDTVDLKDFPQITIGIIANEPSCPESTDGRMGVNQVYGGIGGDNPDNYSFRWSTGDNSIIISGLSGNQNYAVTATDARGCEGVQTRFLPIPDTIAFDLDIIDVSCHGGNDGSIEIENITGQGTSFSVAWGPGTGDQAGLKVESLSAGNYSVTITDGEGCINSNSLMINEPAPVTIQFQTEDISCYGGKEGSIQAVASGGRPDYSYSWTAGLASEPFVDNLPAGTYSLTVTDANGCLASAGTTLDQPETVEVNLNITDVTCFGGRDGRIEISTIGGTPPYTYSSDNINYDLVPTLIGLEAGTRVVYVRDDQGCLYSEQVTIQSPPVFQLDLGPDIRINLGDTVNLNVDLIDAAGNSADLFWSAPYQGTLSCEQCDSPAVWPQNTIIYTVTGYDANGCQAEDQVQVVVQKNRTVLVPTGFTPNGDQINDLLIVHGQEGTHIKVFRIFDRWGDLLFEKFDFPVNDPVNGWDGTFRGQPLNNGLYIWYLEAIYPFDQLQQSFKGQTTLIR